jgi:hypothetical protein
VQWLPELHCHAPGVPIVLVGDGLDMREDPKCVEELRRKGKEPISTTQGEQMRTDIGAVAYVECSGLTRKDVKLVFDEAIRACLRKGPSISTVPVLPHVGARARARAYVRRPPLHRDWARPLPTSAPGLRPYCPHLHRDWARPLPTSAPGHGSPTAHICTGTGLASTALAGFSTVCATAHIRHLHLPLQNAAAPPLPLTRKLCERCRGFFVLPV